MNGGELAGTSVPTVVRALARVQASGCLRVDPQRGAATLMFFESGMLYAVLVPGRRPSLGTRLVTAGALDPETLSQTLELQMKTATGMRLGDLLVANGHVPRDLIEQVVAERLLADCDAVFAVTSGRWSFEVNATFRVRMTDPMSVDALCDAVSKRDETVAECRRLVPQDSVALVANRPRGIDETALPPEARTLLTGIDGVHRVEELAQDFALTPHEGYRAVAALIEAGLVTHPDDPLALQLDDPQNPGFDALGQIVSATAADTDPEAANHDTAEAALRQAGTEAVRSAVQMAARAEKTAFARQEAGGRAPAAPTPAASNEVDTAALLRELASLGSRVPSR